MRSKLFAIPFLLFAAGCNQAPPVESVAPVAAREESSEAAAVDSALASPDTPAPTDSPAKAAERKEIIVITTAAAEQLRALISATEDAKFLRVGVTEDLEQQLSLESQADVDRDIVGESNGIPVVVDRASAAMIAAGTRVDHLSEQGQTGFKFRPPEFDPQAIDTSRSLADARQGFKTTLVREESGDEAAAAPPDGVFDLIKYESPAGELCAYMSPDPSDGERHPAIIWITGGDSNSIGEGCWFDQIPAFDQSASAFRKTGTVMMFPSLRGGNDNPGFNEGFLGEVDDILAAREFLARQTFVDPDRIYLGGHSTGATLVLLVAECTDKFRAVFSFGPISNPIGYGPGQCPFDLSNPAEIRLRAPVAWLHSIRNPVFVIEGSGGNRSELQALDAACTNPLVQFFEVPGTNHFSLLAPLTEILARKVAEDTGPNCAVQVTLAELSRPFSE